MIRYWNALELSSAVNALVCRIIDSRNDFALVFARSPFRSGRP